jgi:ligand-binding sensor domain-containing protein
MPKPVFILTVVLVLAGCIWQSTLGGVNAQETESTSPATPSTHLNSPKPRSATSEERSAIFGANVKIGGVIRSLFQDSRGGLWIGGEGDLLRKDGEKVTSYDLRDDLGKRVTVKQIVEDKNGAIWCGTTGGITRIDGESFTSFGEKDGLLSHDVWSIAADRNGTLWIGTIDGVCRFDGKTFADFSLPPSKPDPTRGITSESIVHCISVDRRGRVWFGTNGGAYIYNGMDLDHISEKDGLPNDVVYKILEDSSGNMWIGTTHNGICRFDGVAFTNFTADGTVDGKEIWCIHEDSARNIWFSGKHFGVYRYDGKAFTKFGANDGINSPGLMSIAEDAKKQLWLGGVNGIFRFNGESFVHVTKQVP